MQDDIPVIGVVLMLVAKPIRTADVNFHISSPFRATYHDPYIAEIRTCIRIQFTGPKNLQRLSINGIQLLLAEQPMLPNMMQKFFLRVWHGVKMTNSWHVSVLKIFLFSVEVGSVYFGLQALQQSGLIQNAFHLLLYQQRFGTGGLGKILALTGIDDGPGGIDQ